jgi:hypothetical protein
MDEGSARLLRALGFLGGFQQDEGAEGAGGGEAGG